MNPRTIRIGISTCPNDTFAFAAAMERRVDWQNLELEIQLLDIEQLNQRLMGGDFDVAKASFHAALLLAEQTVVLPSGSALGFGVGPLLLSTHPGIRPQATSQRTLCPGRLTTATLLYELYYGQTTTVEQTVFSEIMPRLKRAEADFGVCIHEGRFTWQDEGLGLVEDLGTRWEQETGHPLPLGGLVARSSLPVQTIAQVQQVIYDSLSVGLDDPDTALPMMRRFAQAFDDDVLMKHVELYVNPWTQNLGDTGRAALQQFAQCAKRAGLVPSKAKEISVFECP